MEEFKIRDSVPLPEKRKGRKGFYPFRKLEVGQSFEVNGNLQRNLEVLCLYHSRKMNKKFVVRIDDDGVVAVFRVE